MFPDLGRRECELRHGDGARDLLAALQRAGTKASLDLNAGSCVPDDWSCHANPVNCG
jgi:hypothetical protein